MQSFRSLVMNFAYSHLEYLVNLVDQEGDRACIAGYPCCADPSGFTDGVLIDAACMLYLRAQKNRCEHTEAYRLRLLRTIDRISNVSLKTWGKIYALRMLRRLLKEGLLDILPPETLQLLNEKTRYSDFLKVDTLELVSLPSNYYYVAMYCAGIREILGFDPAGNFDRIAAKFTAQIQEGSLDGWMDDQPPHGRFDRYSIENSRLIYEAYLMAGKKPPEFLRENIARANDLYLAARNRQGVGITYGRSLSVYGESATLQTITYALQHNMFPPAEKEEAMAYLLHIAQRMVHFWYREDIRSFDIWLDGRSTNVYRGIHRILEVNLGITLNLLMLLEALDEAGLADYVPEKDISLSPVWEWHKTQFAKDRQTDHCLYVLRRGVHTFMLPLIGMGRRYNDCAYLPVMQESGFLETPVEQQLPFLVPEATLPDGSPVMPIQYFTRVWEESGDDTLTIHAEGNLCRMAGSSGEKTDESFTAQYSFMGNRIRVRFELHASAENLHMLFSGREDLQIRFPHAENVQVRDVSENCQFFMPTGRAQICREAFFSGNTAEYEILL